MNILKRIEKVIFHPKDFFNYIKDETSWKNTLIYHFLVNIVLLAFWVFLVLFILAAVQKQSVLVPITITIIYSFSYLLLFPIFIIIFHLINKLFGAKGNFHDSFKIWIYSLTPTSILAIIPLVGFFAELYSIHLVLVGQEEIHELSFARRIISFLISIFATIGIFIGLYFLLMFSFLIPAMKSYMGGL